MAQAIGVRLLELETISYLLSPGRAKPQEGGGIARAWITYPKIYLINQCPIDGIRVRRDSVSVLLKFQVFVYNICQEWQLLN